MSVLNPYKGDSIIVLAGKNNGKSKEDTSDEKDLIDNSQAKALIPLQGKPIIQHIIPQLLNIRSMHHPTIDKVHIVGPTQDLESILRGYDDQHLNLIEQGQTRIQNVLKGIEVIKKEYPAHSVKELFERIASGTKNPQYFAMSERAKEVPVDLFSSIAHAMVKRIGTGDMPALYEHECKHVISRTIDAQLDDQMLPAWIQRYKVFKTARLKRRYQQYKEKIIEKTYESPLFDQGLIRKHHILRFARTNDLIDFCNYHTARNIGIYVTASDWPFQQRSFDYVISRIKKLQDSGNDLSLYVPLGSERFIRPFHEIDPDYAGAISFRRPHHKIRGWIEAPIELHEQTKFANMLYAKPSRIPKAEMIKTVIENRKGNKRFFFAHLLKSLAKYSSDILINRHGSVGLYTGIHYPMCFNARFFIDGFQSAAASSLDHWILSNQYAHSVLFIRTSGHALKDRLTRRLTLPYLEDTLSHMLGCSLKLEYVPLGTISMDMDRFRHDQHGQKYNPIQRHYSRWKEEELSRAEEVMRHHKVHTVDYEIFRSLR